MDNLIKPYGGILVDLVLDSDKAEHLKKESQHFPSHTLTQRQLCDLELLMNGGFSPLTGFMTEGVYNSVVGDMRLPDRQLWPIPIILDIPENVASKLELNSKLALLDEEGFMLAVLNIESKWQPDK
ncbi:MAG: adenylyltransferase, partial [Gammaproteobacteria bacterium]|nr:adenylyltransferase [Gammaproteobacteria bacterium]